MLRDELIKKVRRIELGLRKLVSSSVSGNYKSHFRGHGVEFSEHRNYFHGDDVRHIDWKASARTRDVLLKKFEEERDLTALLVVDVSGSSIFGSQDQLKSDVIAETSGMLALAASLSGDRVGAILFSGEIQKIIAPKKGRKQVLRIIRDIVAAKPDAPGTDLTSALEAAIRVMKHQGIVIIVSDFYTDNFQMPLKRLARKHDIVAIRVQDRREAEMPRLGYLRVYDPESGSWATFNSSSYSYQNWFQQRNQSFENDLKDKFLRNKVECVPCSTDSDYVEALIRFFRSRKKRRNR